MTSHIRTETEVPVRWRGWTWPTEIKVQWETEDAAYQVIGQMTEEGPKVTRIVVTGPDLGMAQIREPIVSRWRSAFSSVAAAREDGPARVSLAPGGRSIDPTAAINRLAEVAAVYRVAAPRSRARAIAFELGVSEGYARRLVMAARRAGLL